MTIPDKKNKTNHKPNVASFHFSLNLFIFDGVCWMTIFINFLFDGVCWTITFVNFLFDEVYWTMTFVHFLFDGMCWMITFIHFQFDGYTEQWHLSISYLMDMLNKDICPFPIWWVYWTITFVNVIMFDNPFLFNFTYFTCNIFENKVIRELKTKYHSNRNSFVHIIA